MLPRNQKAQSQPLQPSYKDSIHKCYVSVSLLKASAYQDYEQVHVNDLLLSNTIMHDNACINTHL